MDPRVFTEKAAWSSDPGESESGVNHLRRMKLAQAERAPSTPQGHGQATAPAPAKASAEERRKSPRLRCSGSVELRVQGSDVRMWGTLTDISLNGCYVEMASTFPVGSRVQLVLTSCGRRILSPGTIRASYPSLGMGIYFTDTQPVQRLELQQLIAKLAGQTAPPPVSTEQAVILDAETVDSRAVLDEIADFFQKKPVLSREEFHQIADRVRRS